MTRKRKKKQLSKLEQIEHKINTKLKKIKDFEEFALFIKKLKETNEKLAIKLYFNSEDVIKLWPSKLLGSKWFIVKTNKEVYTINNKEISKFSIKLMVKNEGL